MPNYIDLGPAAVAGSGHRTAATSQEWAVWARRMGEDLRNSAAGTRDSVARGLFEESLSAWIPTLWEAEAEAEALGGDAVAAAATMVGADQQSAGALNQAAADASRVGSLLLRGINS